MLKKYRTVSQCGMAEIIIKKSRFLCYAKSIESTKDAEDFILEIKQKHKDASHNCSAYIFGDSDQYKKANDDGEPQGTAGLPILKVIEREGFKNTVVVVTRYFGGVKLGANGLIRAYADGAHEALMASSPCQKILSAEMVFTLPYTALGKMQNELSLLGYQTKDIEYGENVIFTMEIDMDQVIAFEDFVFNFTQGQEKPRTVNQYYRVQEE